MKSCVVLRNVQSVNVPSRSEGALFPTLHHRPLRASPPSLPLNTSRGLPKTFQNPRAARRNVVVCSSDRDDVPMPPKGGKKTQLERFTAGFAAAALSIALVSADLPASADLNRFEYEQGGEFGTGSAQQYGEADVQGQDFSNKDLRRANFTAADARRADFHNSNLQGAYFIKSVVFQANFENANLSDVLMDRAVLNEANLKNALLLRAVLTRSDLGKADILNADFTNALIDKEQQMALCKYADGVNPVTGTATRKSLGCGSKRARLSSTPSNPEGPQPSEEEKEGFLATVPKFRE